MLFAQQRGMWTRLTYRCAVCGKIATLDFRASPFAQCARCTTPLLLDGGAHRIHSSELAELQFVKANALVVFAVKSDGTFEKADALARELCGEVVVLVLDLEEDGPAHLFHDRNGQPRCILYFDAREVRRSKELPSAASIRGVLSRRRERRGGLIHAARA